MKNLVPLFICGFMIVSAHGQIDPFKRNLYIIVVGVSEYKNFPDKNLKYADKDALQLLKKFHESDLYNKVIPFQLTNKQVTRENVLRLRNELMKSTVDDQVILFFSGHGVIDTTLDFYFCTYDFDLNAPSKTGIAFEEMEYLLDSIPARRKLFMIDACHSGEIDKDEFIKTKRKLTPGVIVDNSKAITPVSNAKRQHHFDMMKELFVDVRRSTGAAVIASSGGLSVSYEKDEWKNGLFTYAILSNLKKGIKVSELTNLVIQTAKTLSGGSQIPVIREENIEYDYVVW